MRSIEFVEPELCIVVELDQSAFDAAGVLLQEGPDWRQSEFPDYFYRVDPARPEFKVKRHVTIAHKKHLKAKNKHVSWSDDATRHDKKTFDVNFKGFSKAYDIARTALKLPPDVQLERISDLESLNRLTESAAGKRHCAEIGYARADIIVKAHVVVRSGAQKLFDLLG